MLTSCACKVEECAGLTAEPVQRTWKRFTAQGLYAWLPRAFTKLRALELPEARVLLLDADVAEAPAPEFHSDSIVCGRSIFSDSLGPMVIKKKE